MGEEGVYPARKKSNSQTHKHKHIGQHVATDKTGVVDELILYTVYIQYCRLIHTVHCTVCIYISFIYVYFSYFYELFLPFYIRLFYTGFLYTVRTEGGYSVLNTVKL